MGNEGPSAERHEAGHTVLMSLGEHLEELRRRLIKCLIALGVAFILCWVFRERLVAVLVRPHVRAMLALGLETTLKFASYLEPVVAQLKACVIAALVVTAPLVFYQVWAFVAPGLFPHERYRAAKLGAACAVCFAAGVCFGYFLFVPVALRYLLRLSGAATEPVLMIGSYLSMFFLLTFALGVAFQTPVVIFYLIRWGVLDVEGLQSRRKGVILGAFIIGAVLTPPDPLTQVMMAVTLVVLYDLGGLLAAPSRATFISFFKFTGSIVLLMTVLLAWFTFWPVADVTALAGVVRVGEGALGQGETATLRRGVVCRTAEDASARITLRGRHGPVIHLVGDGQIQVHSRSKVTLYPAESLVSNLDRGVPLEVQTRAAVVSVDRARVELVAKDADSLTVTVLEGAVTAKAEGQEKRITAGRAATLHHGGELTDLPEVERRWQQRMEK